MSDKEQKPGTGTKKSRRELELAMLQEVVRKVRPQLNRLDRLYEESEASALRDERRYD